MSNENRIEYPIQTMREGNKITKICVEDIYKIINRIGAAEERACEKWNQIMDEIEKDVPNANGEIGTGCLIVGTGVSQPNIKDAFDEKIGNNIAFMKAKLNANIKKRNVLRKLWEASMITINAIDEEWSKIDNMIALDLNGLRRYNAEYLNYLDEFGYEIQEEIEEPGCED
jgi:hypothetical protein